MSKLQVTVAILACCALGILFAESIGKLAGIEPSIVAAAALAAFGTGLFALGRALKCAQCGTSRLWYTMTHARNAHWLDALLKEGACPKCGRLKA